MEFLMMTHGHFLSELYLNTCSNQLAGHLNRLECNRLIVLSRR